MVIVVNFRTPELVAECLASIEQERRSLPGIEAFVVDGGSGDDSAQHICTTIDRMQAQDWIHFRALPVNGGFAYANNQALLHLARTEALPERVLLLNPDAALRPGSLHGLMARMAAHPRIAAVGAQLENADGAPVKSIFRFPSALENFLWACRSGLLRSLFGRPELPVEPASACRVDAVTGAAMLIRVSALREVGAFNDHFFLYFEETELCRRLWRAGWEVWTEPAARVMHMCGQATKLFDSDTGERHRQRLPTYWFDSWNRYFLVTQGRAYALLAAFAWSLGLTVWLIRCLLTARELDQPPHIAADLWHAVLKQAPARIRKPVTLGEAPGEAPGWQSLSSAKE